MPSEWNGTLCAAFGGAVTIKKSLVYGVYGISRLHPKQKAGKYANHSLSRCLSEILQEISMAHLFVTLGHNRLSKLVWISLCLSIDFSDRAGTNPDDIRCESLFKAISWRVLATTDTRMIAWLPTGNLKTAGSIMWLEIFTTMLLYFVHDQFRHDFYGCETDISLWQNRKLIGKL